MRPSAPLLSVPPKIFGCVCFILIPNYQRVKLDPKIAKCIIVRYPRTKRVSNLLAYDQTFFEDIPFYSPDSKELIEPSRQIHLLFWSMYHHRLVQKHLRQLIITEGTPERILEIEASGIVEKKLIITDQFSFASRRPKTLKSI